MVLILVVVTATLTKTKMAYRRRQGITKTSTFTEEIHHPPPPDYNNNNNNEFTRSSSSSSSSSSSGGGGGTLPNSTSYTSLAAQAIRASAVHRESSLSSAYADSAFASRPSKVPFFSFLFFSLLAFQIQSYSSNGSWVFIKRSVCVCFVLDLISYLEKRRYFMHSFS